MSTAALVFTVLAACVSHAQAAEPCPNEAIRRLQTYASQLPDCRAYEQVTPVEKHLSDVVGGVGLVRVSPDGERVSYGSVGGFAGVGGTSTLPLYVSERDGSSDWSTFGLLPATRPGESAETRFAPETLSFALVDYSGNRDFLYTPSTRELTPFPSTGEGLVGASSDGSTLLFQSKESLLPEAGSESGVFNVYEWKAGTLSLVAPDAVAGPVVQQDEEFPTTYAEGAISANGSRVFYTSLRPSQSGQIFMREDLGTPVQVSEGPGKADWREAAPDGSSVIYISDGALYRWSWKEGTSHTTLIAPATGEGVAGTLGMSNDGAYVYFASTAVLAATLAGGQRAGQPVEQEGKANLYEWHEERPGVGAYTYIATLSAGTSVNKFRNGLDSDNWLIKQEQEPGAPAEGFRMSQVTPDGRALLFTSWEQITNPPSLGPFAIYRYDATRSELACVSCNPDGKTPTPSPTLSMQPANLTLAPSRLLRPYALHNMSDDGRKIFFDTSGALVPEDHNGAPDVYEWEDGRLYLISCGCAGSSAYIAGDSASPSGSDVFFFTRAQLVAQDRDETIDVYDAREPGEGPEPREAGIPAQNQVVPPSCSEGERCDGPLPTAPSAPVPASVAYSGSGNVVSPSVTTGAGGKAKSKPKRPARRRCRRGRRLDKHHKCVKAKTGRRGR